MKKIIIVLAFSFIIPNLDWRIWADMFPAMSNVIQCESRFNERAYNPKDTDGLPAYGILQFKKATFFKWAKLAEIESPDIWDPWQQIVLYRWADENNLLRHWGCWNQLSRNKIFRALYIEL